jgi:hypothetical protein
VNQPNQANGQGQGGQGQRNRRRRSRKGRSLDVWRPVPVLDDPDPIVPAADPAALLRSLGAPPLHGQGAVAEHYLAAVVDRASGLATALAAAADLLAAPDEDE